MWSNKQVECAEVLRVHWEEGSQSQARKEERKVEAQHEEKLVNGTDC